MNDKDTKDKKKPKKEGDGNSKRPRPHLDIMGKGSDERLSPEDTQKDVEKG
jgi:hypothetical protein